MYVRLKRRKLSGTDDYSVHAVLVESCRKNGVPRQRFVAYLGSIREPELQIQIAIKQFVGTVNRRVEVLNLHPLISAHLKISLIDQIRNYQKRHLPL